MPPKRSKQDQEDQEDPSKSEKPAKKDKGVPKAKGISWTSNEEASLMRGVYKAGMASIKSIATEPGLEGRDLNRINIKLKSLAKATDKNLGGDGKWIDEYTKRKTSDKNGTEE
ncbi:unnamed protein product [Sympodiomycopsis kandeliae]